MTKEAVVFILALSRTLDRPQRTMDDEQGTKDKGGKMDILWIVNTNTFLLVILIIMVSYLTAQVSALIRWLRRE